jgi:hypothetical protein
VVFPIAAGLLMDHFGVGVPFWLAGVLVLLTLPLTGSIAPHPAPAPSTATEDLRIAAADITGEIPTPPRA